MGFQLTVTVYCPGASREQVISGDFPRSQYHHLPLITGMMVEEVARECWSQLVGYETAKTICAIAGMAPSFSGIAPAQLKESLLIRATIS